MGAGVYESSQAASWCCARRQCGVLKFRSLRQQYCNYSCQKNAPAKGWQNFATSIMPSSQSRPRNACDGRAFLSSPWHKYSKILYGAPDSCGEGKRRCCLYSSTCCDYFLMSVGTRNFLFSPFLKLSLLLFKSALTLFYTWSFWNATRCQIVFLFSCYQSDLIVWCQYRRKSHCHSWTRSCVIISIRNHLISTAFGALCYTCFPP